MIRARMFLVAPASVARAFDEMTSAWESLVWRLNEDGPVMVIGSEAFHAANPDDKDVTRVMNALKRLKSEIRSEALGPVD